MTAFGQPPGGGFGPPPGSSPGGGFGQPQSGGFGQPQGGGFGPPPGGGGGFGPQGGGYGGPPAAQGGAGPMAIASLILGIMSFFVCPFFLSVPGAIIGKLEMGKIERGESPAAGLGLAKAGFYISLINVALTVIGVCGYFAIVFLFFGLASAGSY